MQQQMIHQFPIDQIVSRPQVRRHFDRKALSELAETIKSKGIHQPIRVRRDGDQLVIVFGERRWRAAKLAGLTTVPAIVIDGEMSESEILESQLVENVQRENLDPLEFALGVDALMKASGCTAAQAAAKVGRSPATISKVLSLLTLPPDVQQRVASGEIGLRAGHTMARGARIQGTSTAENTPQNKPFTAVIDAVRRLSFSGIEPTFDAVTNALKTGLALLRAAEKQGMGLHTALAMLRDQATS